jgi:glycosyltransferase involved in cell wall biosynthesis
MLSFIVPAYNEELELPSTLAAIHAAATAYSVSYEIIVVNDGSTDATEAVAAAGGARVLTIHRRQIAAARNAGGRDARGDILFFVDADTRIAQQHVSGAVTALESGCVGGGARIEFNDEIPTWARIFFSVFGKLYFGANLGAGAFLFTTRSVFNRSGGFDEQYFAGEEVYFTQALKKLGRFRLLDDPVVTSSRKLRMYSARDVLGVFVGIMFRGKRAVRSRERLDLWYDGKRETEMRAPAAGMAQE